MKNSIDERIARLKKEGRTGLMTHLIVGYPTLGATVELIATMEKAGADFVEIQIPFADPLADGATIQKACEISLERGTTVNDAFVVARAAAERVQVPLLFMAYFNTVYQYGVDRFCADARAAGISGLIIPDAPLEAAEAEGLLRSCDKYNLYNIFTLSPASTEERIVKNVARAKGFMYCMARQGVTGAAQALDPKVQTYLQNIREHTSVPLAVGFGISNRERFLTIAPHCEIAVVGSALIDTINASGLSEMNKDVYAFVQSLLSDEER